MAFIPLIGPYRWKMVTGDIGNVRAKAVSTSIGIASDCSITCDLGMLRNASQFVGLVGSGSGLAAYQRWVG